MKINAAVFTTKMIQELYLQNHWVLHFENPQTKQRNVNNYQNNTKDNKSDLFEVCWFIKVKQANYINSDVILNLATLPLNVSMIYLNADEVDLDKDVSILIIYLLS